MDLLGSIWILAAWLRLRRDLRGTAGSKAAGGGGGVGATTGAGSIRDVTI